MSSGNLKRGPYSNAHKDKDENLFFIPLKIRPEPPSHSNISHETVINNLQERLIRRLKTQQGDMSVMESQAKNHETFGSKHNQSNIRYSTFENMTDTTGNIQIDENVTQQHSHNTNTRQKVDRGRPVLKKTRSYYTPHMEDQLARELKFFFMGPHEKFIARRKCPWKLIIQVVKIVLVTIQLPAVMDDTACSIVVLQYCGVSYFSDELVQFGYSHYSFIEFEVNMKISMKHLYLKDWTNSYETLSYPPAIGKYALYEVWQIPEHINFGMEKYDLTENIAIGSLRFYRYTNHTPIPIQLCLKEYRSGKINDTTNRYDIDSTIDTTCYPVRKLDNGTYNITYYLLDQYNKTLDSDRLLTLDMKFSLKSFRLEMAQRNFPPQMFKVDVIISFDDSNKDGQMSVQLTTTLNEEEIETHSTTEDAQKRDKILALFFDSVIIIFTVISMVLCMRSIIRAQLLCRKTNTYFRKRHGKSLSMSDQCEFINLWYITIVINDILTIFGSGYKIQLETRNLKSSSNNYDYCGLLLGTGSLLAWLGVLRYIGFFQQFNVLIVTLKKAFPNMIRFLVCCILLYIGFVICGWVVLGPYHIKFRQLSTASETLFALINGDDMFVTFSATQTPNNLMWYYSRIYLYLFISLFIYCVMNLFIAVILDTYETIKKYYRDGFPKSELFTFIDQCEDQASSLMYRKEDTGCNLIHTLCCCGYCRSKDDESEYKPLLMKT